MGVQLGPCGVMGLREGSHRAGRVGPKGVLLHMLPWPGQSFGLSASSGQQALPDLLPGEERRVTEEVQPPPGSQDWDVLLTHRAGLRGPLREGSRQPPSCRSGSRLQWLILATRRHCSPNYLPQGQKRGPRARPADASPTFVEDPGLLPGRAGQTSGDVVLLRVCQYPSPPRDAAVGEAGPCPLQSFFLLRF